MSEPLKCEQLSKSKALAATLAYERSLYETGETSFAVRWEDAAWDGKVEEVITALILEVERQRRRAYSLIARFETYNQQAKARLQEELDEMAKSYAKGGGMTVACWIPLTTRPPEQLSPELPHSAPVLVWPRGNCPVAVYVHSLGGWLDLQGRERRDVTHWAEMPPGPKS